MGAVVGTRTVWSKTLWALPVLVGLVLPLWEDGPPSEVPVSLVIAGLLLKARQAHAERPGAWFPLLVTGSTAFVLAFALSGGWAAGWWLSIGSTYFGLVRFLIGLAIALGLGAWAWRARSYTVAGTAAGYLAAVWYFQPLSMPVAAFGWMSYAPINEPIDEAPLLNPGATLDVTGGLPYPELVIVAGAVLAHAGSGRVRPWHVVAIAGLLGSLWHYGAAALLVAAVVVAAYDLNARRPGAWYPLLLVGIGLVVWPVVDRLVLAAQLPSMLADAPGGPNDMVVIYGISTGVGPWVDYDELFLAFVVAVGLAVWSWRRNSPIMLLTAVVYLGLTWLRTTPVPTELVVLAGAAVAFATTTAPGAAGRSAGTPDLPPGR
jgi:hypothetical protein